MYGKTLMSASVMVTSKNIRSENQFLQKFALKTFPCYRANAKTEGLKSLHTLFDTYLDYMLVIFEPNRIVQNVQKNELLD